MSQVQTRCRWRVRDLDLGQAPGQEPVQEPFPASEALALAPLTQVEKAFASYEASVPSTRSGYIPGSWNAHVWRGCSEVVAVSDWAETRSEDVFGASESNLPITT